MIFCIRDLLKILLKTMDFPFLKYYSALYIGAFNGVETKN